MCIEQKEVSNGVVGEGQGWRLSEEDNSRINDLNENINNGLAESSQVNDRLQPLQPQPQAPGICWERFLPVQSLKVLLVENDDSTRHVVGALLRNCSYEVNAVANGLQAWKVLEDPDNRTDLILTEVIMPALSGFGLLCKIMSHKTLKNIPVIMMSSHDAMGIVFKCLSKGAVDFLVKPIRKNELKNLWQHVWRRCHSCSGSVSESGTQTRKSTKLKSTKESENDTSSSDENDNGSTGLSIQDGSDNESGTQNLRADEFDRSLKMSLEGQLADAPDSICALMIHTEPEKCSNMWVHFTGQKECVEQDERHDSKQFGEGQLECKIENMSNSINVNCTEQKAESRIFDAPFGTSDVSQVKAKFYSGELPSLELTLRRSRGADAGNFTHDECRTLRHSDLSAFSKYNTVSSTNQTPAGKVGGCSPCENSSIVTSRGAGRNFPSDSYAIPPNQQSNENSSMNDVCSANANVMPKLEASSDKLESLSAFKSSHSSAFRPVRSGGISLAPQVILTEQDGSKAEPVQVPITDQRVQVQHHHHHHHHYYHHVHNEEKHQLHQDHNDISLKNTASATQQSGSSNAFEFPIESQDGNYSQNGSASGSNHGSNGQNGTYAAVSPVVTNVESDNGAAGNSGTGDISRGNSRSWVDENRIARREAALTKFRQKRKARCFEKKVRYQSRKKLAEQRPRVRGQFVRQTESDAKAGNDHQDQDETSCGSGQ